MSKACPACPLQLARFLIPNHFCKVTTHTSSGASCNQGMHELHCSIMMDLIQVSKRELLAVQTSKATLNRLLARVRRLTEVNLFRNPTPASCSSCFSTNLLLWTHSMQLSVAGHMHHMHSSRCIANRQYSACFWHAALVQPHACCACEKDYLVW